MAHTFKPALATEKDFKLFNLTDVDRATLRQTDEECVPHDWQELKTIIGKCLSTHTYQALHCTTSSPFKNSLKTCH